MNKVFKKIIEKLKEEKMSYFLTIANTGDEKLDCAYEQVGDALDKAIEIVKQEAAAYEECYKDCGDCEAYNKEKHHCPKFCKVIKETVKEIEENHNGWIPCSEHQPEEAGTYNVTAYDGRTLRSTHAKWQPRLKSWNLTGTMAYWKIIAWQPLPQPYQPKGDYDENTN